MAKPFQEKFFQEKNEPEAIKLKKLDLLDNVENAEIKMLANEDVDEVYNIMRRTLWEVSKQQIVEIIKFGTSYGAYVERMLVGLGLAWPAHYDAKKKKMTAGKANALYIEDIALLLTYEGRGIRKMLVQEREKTAKALGFLYIIAFISSDWPAGSLEDMIKERGNRAEKAYLTDGYKFFRAKEGILAVKEL